MLRTFLLLFSVIMVAANAAQRAEAAPQQLVMPGREVVVAIPRSDTFGALALSSGELRAPNHIHLLPAAGRSRIRVATLKGVAGSLSKEPVPVNDTQVREMCSAIRRSNPSVPILCEANIIFRAARIPNDPSFGSLYSMALVGAPTAWDTSTGSPQITVAIIDSGIDYLHPDLHSNVRVNSGEVPSNLVDDDNNGFVDDYYGYDFVNLDGEPMDDDSHGSHCAGTIGARGNNSLGVAGMNWQVGLLGVKVLDGSGQGYLSDVASGIQYAADRGASVISLSLGAPSTSQVLEDAISYAAAQGVLLVAAAGNEGSNNDSTPSYPASSTSSHILSVAATDQSDSLASFSNFGALSVDVGAPGVSILSTVPGNSYQFMSGTSMAAPLVAGLAALIKSVDNTLTALEIKQIIMATGEPLAALDGMTVTGKRVDAAAAIATAGNIAQPTPSPTPQASPTAVPKTNTLTLSFRRAGRRIFLFGQITGARRKAVSGALISLMCNQRNVASKRSSSSGSYRFSRPIPSRRTSCFVKDPSGNRSRSRFIRR